jgi:hypothetical protein
MIYLFCMVQLQIEIILDVNKLILSTTVNGPWQRIVYEERMKGKVRMVRRCKKIK